MRTPVRPILGSLRTSWIVIAVLVVGLSAVLSIRWLFRTESVDNPALGLISHHYRWGRMTEILVDANRNGTNDARLIVSSPGSRLGDTGIEVSEGWESTQRDGRFDLHYWHDLSSGLLVVEHDSTGDGVLDKRIEGQAAEEFLRSISVHP